MTVEMLQASVQERVLMDFKIASGTVDLYQRLFWNGVIPLDDPMRIAELLHDSVNLLLYRDVKSIRNFMYTDLAYNMWGMSRFFFFFFFYIFIQ
jgi:hypothetical protein